MLALGGAYFIAACTLDVMTNVGTIDDLTSSARIFLVLPVAVRLSRTWGALGVVWQCVL